ncbi:aldo/keto reductase [Salinibacterium sp. ZJ77]|uniref:aldo/keto reductase n=1 Tax=Salinibacterium sp. ZJ77 TaxID=2708337 RepID=UPI0014209409|nr:aldo/keto reductase [Salinibacterium sp. ZJ77]
MSVPGITLNTGHEIPQVGLGTWPLDDAQAADAVVAAAELGYRHIDTATKYGNEAGVGEGIRRSGIPREEFFITTKLDGAFQGDDKAVGGLEAALDRLGTDYVDLLLIHWPLPGRGLFVDTWRTFERLHDDGRARAIGVSNFRPEHLDTLLAETRIVPAVNQIQLNPHVTREDHRAFHADHGIVTTSWSPLGGDGASVLNHPIVSQIAEAHGRTPGQIVLRWHVQNGLVVIPKSASPERMRENLDVFDFELTETDLVALGTVSQGPDAGVDSNRTGH